MDSLTYLIILRLLHIVCGILWAGGTIYLASFVAPAVKAIGPDGAKFMQQLAKTNRLPQVMTLVASLNVLSGILLLWNFSNGFQWDWISTRHGMILTIGGLLAIIAYLIGMLVTRPTVVKISVLGQAIAKSGGPPSAEQAQQLAAYRTKIFSANQQVATLLAVTVVAMSLVRYL